eukprot:scaffold50136_cov64-Phaeocystis_antarctica.AAC.3
MALRCLGTACDVLGVSKVVQQRSDGGGRRLARDHGVGVAPARLQAREAQAGEAADCLVGRAPVACLVACLGRRVASAEASVVRVVESAEERVAHFVAAHCQTRRVAVHPHGRLVGQEGVEDDGRAVLDAPSLTRLVIERRALTRAPNAGRGALSTLPDA